MKSDLKALSFEHMQASADVGTTDQSDLPPLHESNVQVGDNEHVSAYIDVTSDAMARLYGGLYTLIQSFAPKMRLPEGKHLLATAIQTQLIEPLSQQFPDFEQFDFTLTDSSIIGNNEFTNTVLNCMNTMVNTPVDERQPDDPHPEYLAALTPGEDHYDHEEEFSWT